MFCLAGTYPLGHMGTGFGFEVTDVGGVPCPRCRVLVVPQAHVIVILEHLGPSPG